MKTKVLTEKIKRVLRRILSSRFKEIDVKAIDSRILREHYYDWRLTPNAPSFNDVFTIKTKMNEAFNDILPPDYVVNQIRNRYGLDKKFIKKVEYHNNVAIYIITALVGNNDSLIINDMMTLGYFLACQGPVQIVNGMSFKELKFEPLSQNQTDDTESIKEVNKKLYYWTPSYNVDSILKNGLIPSHKNTQFNFPPRIYLITSKTTSQNLYQIGFMLALNNSNENNKGDYCLFSVDITNLDDSVRLYYDPNSSIGVYTNEPILPEHLTKLVDHNFFNNNIL